MATNNGRSAENCTIKSIGKLMNKIVKAVGMVGSIASAGSSTVMVHSDKQLFIGVCGQEQLARQLNIGGRGTYRQKNFLTQRCPLHIYSNS